MTKGVPASPSGCQPAASAAISVASSRSGIPNAGEMVERVARALFQAEWAHNGSEEEYASSREYWLEGARVAIEAMRETTGEMLQGACEKHIPGKPMCETTPPMKGWPPNEAECPRFVTRRNIWQRMIDAAQAIEARRVETAKQGSIGDESAVA